MKTNKGSQAAVAVSIHPAGGARTVLLRADAGAMLSLYASLLSRAQLQQWLAQSRQRRYWRALTPLIMLWGMLYQRLQADHTCDAALSYLRSGAVDGLDAQDRHAAPLSQRLRSESTAGYVQGRNRLPLELVQAALHWVAQQVLAWLQATADGRMALRWHDRAVRVLDGSTFRLRPYGDLAQTYGLAHNQKGASYWVIPKALASFCLSSQMCLGYAEGPQQASEPGLCRAVLAQDPEAHCLYIADQGLGVYRVAQVAQHLGHDVVLRLEQQTAKRLLRLAGQPALVSGQACALDWAPAPDAVCEPDWPRPPIAGRLIYLWLAAPGFRPCAIYLFTTLLDPARYPPAEICELYAQRWRGELNLRHIKTTLGMDEFAVQSAALFRKELAVGLLAYNLGCALMTQAALQAGLRPEALSFSRCLRRITTALSYGLPRWLRNTHDPLAFLLARLAACRLPQQPAKVKHEPRRVRHRPKVYPHLWGARHLARQQLLQDMAHASKS